MICSVSRSGAILSAAHDLAVLLVEHLLFGLERGKQVFQFVRLLQLAQVLGVGEGNVDGDVAA